jgi:hypothetical protein
MEMPTCKCSCDVYVQLAENHQPDRDKDHYVQHAARQRYQRAFRQQAAVRQALPNAAENPVRYPRHRPIKRKGQQNQDDPLVILAVQQRCPDEIDKVVMNDDPDKQRARSKPAAWFGRKRWEPPRAAGEVPHKTRHNSGQPAERQRNRREQNDPQPLPQRHSQQAVLNQKGRQFFFDSREAQRIVDFGNLIERLPRNEPELVAARVFQAHQGNRKRFAQASGAAYSDFVLRLAVRPAALGIAADGVERSPEFGAENGIELTRELMFLGGRGVMPFGGRLKILDRHFVVFVLRGAAETNHGSARRIAPQGIGWNSRLWRRWGLRWQQR